MISNTIMKKIITICLFAIALVFSTTTNAQEKQKSPEAVAKEQVHKLSQQLNLDGDQQRALWKALLKKQTAINEAVKSSGSISATELKTLNKQIEQTVSKFLNKEQYKLFLVNQNN